MKSLFNKYIWLQLILSILLLFGGALIIVFAVMNKENILEDGLNIISAVILFLFGLFAILSSFLFEPDKVFTNGLLYGSACIAFGVFLCLGKLTILEYLVYVLAIFFIVIGSIELIKAIVLIIKKEKRILEIILTFVFGALVIAGGILALIYNTEVRIVFCVIAGVILFAGGVYLLILGIKEIIKRNKEKKAPLKKDQEAEEQEVKELDFTENSDSSEK